MNHKDFKLVTEKNLTFNIVLLEGNVDCFSRGPLASAENSKMSFQSKVIISHYAVINFAT